VSILETTHLMMFRETIGVYFENRMKVVIKFSGEFSSVSSVAHVVKYRGFNS